MNIEHLLTLTYKGTNQKDIFHMMLPRPHTRYELTAKVAEYDLCLQDVVGYTVLQHQNACTHKHTHMQCTHTMLLREYWVPLKGTRTSKEKIYNSYADLPYNR